MIRSLRAISFFAALALAGALSAGHSAAQEEESRFDSFKRDFGGFFGGGSSQPRRERQVVASPESELVLRLDRIENQMRQLTGIIEQLQFRNQQLETQLKRMQEDVDFRFQEVGGKPGARQNVPQRQGAIDGGNVVAVQGGGQGAREGGQGGNVVAGGGGRRGDAFDPEANPGAPGSPRVLGGMQRNEARAGERIVQSEVRVQDDRPLRGGEVRVQSDLDDEDDVGGGRRPGTPLDIGQLAARDAPREARRVDAPRERGTEVAARGGELPPPPNRNPNSTGVREVVASAGTPRDQYDAAFGNLQRKDYGAAEEGFRAFLKKHPSDRLAPDAQYWLGESLFQKQKYKDAAESFLTVSTKHESAVKAPDALVRLGQSLAALGEKEAACATLNEVSRKYPKASASVRQTVEREQKRVKC